MAVASRMMARRVWPHATLRVSSDNADSRARATASTLASGRLPAVT